MENLIDLILSRLSKKGIMPFEVPGLLRDILNIIREGGDFTVLMINDRLEYLGWDVEIMDEYTFELVLHLLEDAGGHEIHQRSLH